MTVRFTIGQRISAVTGLLLLLILSVGVGVFLCLTSIRRNVDTLQTQVMPSVIYGGASKVNSAENFINVLLAGHAENQAEIDQALAHIADVSAEHRVILDHYKKAATTPTDLKNLQASMDGHVDYAAKRSEYLKRVGSHDPSATGFLQQQLLPSYVAYSRTNDLLVNTKAEAGNELTRQIVTNTRRTLYALFGVTLGACIAGIAGAFFVIRGLNRLLRQTTAELARNADEVSEAAQHVSTASHSLASGSNAQAASLTESSSALEEVASMTKRNAENTGQANKITRRASDLAARSSSDMDAMSDAMRKIKTSSDDIAKIIKSIDEIAFQTNILALNAAVEAARAGSAGAGFAVVADEVRGLAQRCATSAKETAEKIKTAIDSVNRGVTLTGNVQESLRGIVNEVKSVDSLVSEVTQASNEQSTGVAEVSAAVQQMDKLTHGNAATAESTAAEADLLSDRAAALRELVMDLEKLVGIRHREESGGGVPPPQSRGEAASRRFHVEQPVLETAEA